MVVGEVRLDEARSNQVDEPSHVLGHARVNDAIRLTAALLDI